MTYCKVVPIVPQGSRYSTVSSLRQQNVYVCPRAEININWCEGFVHGQIWLSKLLPQTRTITVYMQPFRDFCDFVHMNPDQLFDYHMQGVILASQNPSQFQQADRINDMLANVVPTMKMKKTGAPITPNSMLRIIVAVHSFFTWNKQTLPKFRFPIVALPNSAIPTVQDIDVMLKNASVRDKAMVAFFASTGFRPETVTLLKWSDLKQTGNVQVPIEIIAMPQIMKGKGASKAYQYCIQVGFLPDKAWKYLKDYQQAINAKPSDSLFISELNPTGKWKTKNFKTKTARNGNSITYYGIWKAIHILGQQTLNKNINATDFRHFVADCCASAGLSDIDVSAYLGHAIRSTNRSYIRLTPSREKDLLNKYITVLPYLT